MQIEQLGPYRLGKKIGQGGMGAVYAAVDTETGEPAAVKVLSPRLAVDESFRVRFEAEIESLKKLRHPNIVRLFGYGEQAGTLFYAMELVEGHSLEDELRQGRRFEWREVTQIAIKLCKALKHAHDHGVIHRDLKPANLLLSNSGELKLSDFGIARLFGNTRLTADGGVLGTAEFMAPEQADGRVVTDRCDQYSLGGVMYTLLAGRPPFQAKSLVEMLQLQRYALPEPVTRYAPQTPAELARIIQQLLDKDPQRRFANTLILARSLEAMERGLSVVTSRESDDFVITPPPDEEATEHPSSRMPPTLTPTQLAEMRAREFSLSSPEHATAATMAFAVAGERRAARETASSATTFTKVDEDRDEASWLQDALGAIVSPQTVGLAAALALLVAIGWYLMRPESADALYGRIETAANTGDVDSLKSARRDMATFLSRYGDDPRAEQVRALEDESQQATPIQRAFSDARRQALTNPDVALARFQAIIDLYDDGPATGENAARYVKLARQQHERLEQRVGKFIEDSRTLVIGRLDKADALAASDPNAARRMYEGVLALYQNKPWAADLVERSHAGLTKVAPPAQP